MMANSMQEDFDDAKSLLAAFVQNTVSQAAQPKQKTEITERSVRAHWKIENGRIHWVTGWIPPTPTDRWAVLSQAPFLPPGTPLPRDSSNVRWNPQLGGMQQVAQTQQAAGGGVQPQERPQIPSNFQQELQEQERSESEWTDASIEPGKSFINEVSAQSWLKLAAQMRSNYISQSNRKEPEPSPPQKAREPTKSIMKPTDDGFLSLTPKKNAPVTLTQTPTREPKNKQELQSTLNPNPPIPEPTLPTSPEKELIITPQPATLPQQPSTEALGAVPTWSKIKDPTKNRRRKGLS